MSNSSRLITVFSCLVVAFTVPSKHSQADDAPPNPLEPLARFVGGQWHTTGSWVTGEKLTSRNVYTWGVGNKIIHGKTFVTGEGGENLRYESVMTWHPKQDTLVIYSFSVDGAVNEYAIEAADKDTLKFGFAPFGDQSSNVRQTITFQTPDSYLWTVQLKQDDTWQEIIQSTWHRTPLAN